MTTYRCMAATSLLMGLAMSGCGTNTRMDDTDYRAIGQPTPRPTLPHPTIATAEQAATQLTPTPLPAPSPAASQSAPLTQAADIANATRQTIGASRIVSTSAQQEVVRYGNSQVIDKIARIMQIHCQPLKYRISTDDSSFWNDSDGILHQCDYQFPTFCGGHSFSLLRSGSKEALVYKPKDANRYIIDSLRGTPKSQPGLWDQDDHIGSGTTNAGYFFTPDYNQPTRQQPFNPAQLGWIIKASHQDEELFGRQYHQAVSDVTRCF